MAAFWPETVTPPLLTVTVPPAPVNDRPSACPVTGLDDGGRLPLARWRSCRPAAPRRRAPGADDISQVPSVAAGVNHVGTGADAVLVGGHRGGAERGDEPAAQLVSQVGELLLQPLACS